MRYKRRLPVLSLPWESFQGYTMLLFWTSLLRWLYVPYDWAQFCLPGIGFSFTLWPVLKFNYWLHVQYYFRNFRCRVCLENIRLWILLGWESLFKRSLEYFRYFHCFFFASDMDIKCNFRWKLSFLYSRI